MAEKIEEEERGGQITHVINQIYSTAKKFDKERKMQSCLPAASASVVVFSTSAWILSTSAFESGLLDSSAFSSSTLARALC